MAEEAPKIWDLNTALEFYSYIQKGEKTWDTRVPDSSDHKKQFDQAKKGDLARIIPVDDFHFKPVRSLPALNYKIDEVKIFGPPNNNDPIRTLSNLTNEINIKAIFPNYDFREAIELYKRFGVYEQIAQNGIVAFHLGKQINEVNSSASECYIEPQFRVSPFRRVLHYATMIAGLIPNLVYRSIENKIKSKKN